MFVKPHQWKALAETFSMIWLNIKCIQKKIKIPATLVWLSHPKQVRTHLPKESVSFLLCYPCSTYYTLQPEFYQFGKSFAQSFSVNGSANSSLRRFLKLSQCTYRKERNFLSFATPTRCGTHLRPTLVAGTRSYYQKILLLSGVRMDFEVVRLFWNKGTHFVQCPILCCRRSKQEAKSAPLWHLL